MNLRTITALFCFCVALYFGRLAAQGMTSEYVCSMVHPILGTDMEIGCVYRRDQNFVYWKRVILYSIISLGGVVLGASYAGDSRNS